LDVAQLAQVDLSEIDVLLLPSGSYEETIGPGSRLPSLLESHDPDPAQRRALRPEHGGGRGALTQNGEAVEVD